MSRLLLATLFLFAGAAHAQDWQLVWADEFDGSGAPDPAKWGYDIGGNGWGNNELQYYTDRTENARQENGNLVIEAREESFGGRQYTSARLVTRNLASWTYGRFEARIKLPVGQGIWPAFWMLAEDSPYGNWPLSGEIDIMEYLGHQPRRVHGTIHYGGGTYAPCRGQRGAVLGHCFTGRSYDLPSGQVFPDDFHTFAVEWEPQRIRWFVDDVMYQEQTYWYSGAAGYPAPFDQAFHLLLNVAVGGNWPGAPDASTQFPQTMLVDYVRVFQDPSAAPQVALTSPSTGETAPAGASVTFTADASDGGEIERVEFLQSGGILGVDTEAPYEWTVDDLYPGCYPISVRAVDDAGYQTVSEAVTLTVGSGCPEGHAAPFLLTPTRLPGRLEAEHYDVGGANVAYRDLGDVNSGGSYRPDEGVDIAASRDTGGGFEIVDIINREWVSYTVRVTETGSYRIRARIAADSDEQIAVLLDGEDLFGTIDLARTASATAYGTRTLGTTDLSEGVHTFRVNMRSGGFVLNWIEFERLGATPTEDGAEADDLGLRVSPNPVSRRATVQYTLTQPGRVRLAVFDAVGRRVRGLEPGLVGAGEQSASVDVAGLAPGAYVMVLTTPSGMHARRFAVVR